jgi:hypothetical protein
MHVNLTNFGLGGAVICYIFDLHLFPQMLVNKIINPIKIFIYRKLCKNTLHTTLNSIPPWWEPAILVPAGLGHYYQHSNVVTDKRM